MSRAIRARLHQDPPPAFWLLGCGGTAKAGLETTDRLYRADRSPFFMRSTISDTDPLPTEAADSTLSLGVDVQQLNAVLADPQAFGPISELMVRRYRQFLNPDSIKNGARTVRLNTQFAVEVNRQRIVDHFAADIRELVRQSGAATVQPVLFASSGGGTGSALVVTLGVLLTDPYFRARITEGLSPNLLDTPVAIMAEPFAHALKHSDAHANKILANAMAFRIETALLEAHNVFQYIIHEGMANSNGTVLDTMPQVSKVLGTMIYQFCKNWSHLKARFVDTVDSQVLTDRYRGRDVPEQHFPVTLHPAFASKLPPRHISHRIRVILNGRNHHETRPTNRPR